MATGSLLRRHRDFRLLWTAETVSEMGSSVSMVALPLVAVVTLHASTFQVAALAAVETVAWPVLGLPAGVWVDRLARRPVLVAADLGRAAVLLSVPVAAALGQLTLAQLYVAAFVTGVLTIFFSVAYTAYLPSLVDTEDLVEGNSALGASSSAANIAGPALGGALVQLVGAAFAVLADVASFVLSAATLGAIRTQEAPPEPAARSMRRELGEGVRFLLHHPLLRAFVGAAGTFNLFLSGTSALVVVFLVRVVHLHSGAVGLLLAVGSVGGLVGALLARRAVAAVGDARAMVLAATIGPVAGLLVPLTHPGAGLVFFCVGVFVEMGGIAVFNVVAGTYRATASPPRLLGRVVAANRMVTWGLMPVGALLAGWLASTLGTRDALWVLGAGTLLTPAWYSLAGIARMRTLPTGTTPTAAPAGSLLAAGNEESLRSSSSS